MWSFEQRPISTSRHPRLRIQGQQSAAFENLYLAAAVRRVIFAGIKADDFGAPQVAGVPEQHDRSVPQTARSEGQGGHHCNDILSADRRFLDRRAGMFAFDPGEHCRDVAAFVIEDKAALRVVPGEAVKSALSCRCR